MNTMNKVFVPSMVVGLVLSLCRLAAGIDDGEGDLLRLVAEGWKANQERIVTWKGRAVTEVYHGKEFKGDVRDYPVESIEIDFSYDAEGAVSAWHARIAAPGSGENDYGRPVETEGRLETPDADYVLPRGAREGSERRMCYVYPHYNLAGGRRKHFDAVGSMLPRIMDFSHTCELYRKRLDDPLLGYFVERDGHLVRFGYRKPHGAVLEYTCDTLAGFNVVSYRNEHPEGNTLDWNASYVEADGVWVLKEVSETMSTPEGERLSKVVTRFEASRVNARLDAREFSLEAIGVTAGDQIYDSRTAAEYVYGEETPPKKGLLDEVEVADLLLDVVDRDGVLEGEEPAEVAHSGVVAPSAAPVVAAPSAPPDEPRRYGVYSVIIALILLAALCVFAVRLLRRSAGTKGN